MGSFFFGGGEGGGLVFRYLGFRGLWLLPPQTKAAKV